MQSSKILAFATAASLTFILPTSSHAQYGGPSKRDHRIANQSTENVRDHRANAQPNVNVRDHRITSQSTENVRDHRADAQPNVNMRDHRTTRQPTANVRDHRSASPGLVSSAGDGIKHGAKKVATAGGKLVVAPVRTAVNAGSKVVGGAIKVGGAVKSAAKKLNPFD